MVKGGLCKMSFSIFPVSDGILHWYIFYSARGWRSGFLFGNLFSILYSLAGGMFSFLVMYLLKRTGKLGVLPVSVAGGMSHNIGQIAVAAFVVENINIFYYLPVLFVAGIVTGLLIGVAAQEIILRIGGRLKR